MRAALLPVLTLAVLATLLACGGAAPQDLDPPAGAGGADSGSPGDAGPGTKDGGSTKDGGGISDASGGKDTGAADADGFVWSSIAVQQLWENCMPSVELDPVQMQGSISIQNGTSGTVGPIDVSSGSFLDATTLIPIATFQVTPSTIAAIGPGKSITVNIQKAPGSVKPANRCTTLPCGGKVVVNIDARGPGVPQGLPMRTSAIQVVCAM